MKWQKRGLIYRPAGDKNWAFHTASQPTPVAWGPDLIRVFIGCRDANGVTRIGYVDVAASDQSGLAATAHCTIALGTQSIDGFLQFNPATKTYEGAIPILRGSAKAAVLKSVDLADAAGNHKVFRLN